MKKFTVKTIVVLVATMLVAFKSVSRLMNSDMPLVDFLTYPVLIPSISIEAPLLSEYIEPTQHEMFLEALGFKESGNDYEATNRFGYLGRYQFGRLTLNGLGFSDISNREFLSNPVLQEQAMDSLLSHNANILKNFIEKYDGKYVRGIFVTESGILAAAHLAGPKNVKKWFRTGKDFEDGLGTKLSTYLKNFSGYELDL